MVGIGGGFILVPVLILLFPDKPTETVTSISLAVVFLNAASCFIGYLREDRVDIRSGIMFAIAAVPAAILGAIATAKVGSVTFDAAFGLTMIAGAVYLLWRSRIIKLKRVRDDWPSTNRVLLDKTDWIYRYNVNEPLGMGVSAVAGGAPVF
ncbi:MAG: sulfite exporter TauE/SafE family protein [Dehalococcoidia bacterium]|nr:sulfite exporter TauE/SafE family protein [Dehalococcoidia bacterium]